MAVSSQTFTFVFISQKSEYINALNCTCFSVCIKVSEQQLNEAIAQAVEHSRLRRDRSQWSMDGCNSSELLIFCLPVSHTLQLQCVSDFTA